MARPGHARGPERSGRPLRSAGRGQRHQRAARLHRAGEIRRARRARAKRRGSHRQGAYRAWPVRRARLRHRCSWTSTCRTWTGSRRRGGSGRSIRTTPRPRPGRPPIVALTANAFAEDRDAYLQAGLDDYLAKPFEKADLAALLARWRRPGAVAEERIRARRRVIAEGTRRSLRVIPASCALSPDCHIELRIGLLTG